MTKSCGCDAACYGYGADYARDEKDEREQSHQRSGVAGVSGFTGFSGFSGVYPAELEIMNAPEPKPPEIVLDTLVLCNHKFEDFPWAGQHPLSGRIYKVTAVDQVREGSVLFLGLEGVNNGRPGWNAVYFIPIKDTQEKPEVEKPLRRVIRCEEEDNGSNT